MFEAGLPSIVVESPKFDVKYVPISDIRHVVLEKQYKSLLGKVLAEGPADKSLNSLDLIGFEDFKVLAAIPDNFFHYFLDFVGPILVLINACPEDQRNKIKILIDETNTNYEKRNYQKIVFDILDRLGVRYERINLSQYDAVNLQNFVMIYGGSLAETNTLLTRCIYDLVKPEPVHPHRKVYLTRRLDQAKNGDDRASNEELLEQYFSSKGFEIVYAEQFKDIYEQINFFNEVRLLASTTGAGLTNMLFMQPEQAVIEIVSPILLGDAEGGFLKKEVHHLYKELSLVKNHIMVSVQNLNQDSVDSIFLLEKYNFGANIV
jgi:hypothetical protein